MFILCLPYVVCNVSLDQLVFCSERALNHNISSLPFFLPSYGQMGVGTCLTQCTSEALSCCFEAVAAVYVHVSRCLHKSQDTA